MKYVIWMVCDQTIGFIAPGGSIVFKGSEAHVFDTVEAAQEAVATDPYPDECEIRAIAPKEMEAFLLEDHTW